MEMIELLRKAWSTCARCKLHERRTQVVFGSGSPHAKLVIIGEAPGKEEDERGYPFAGASGQLLNATISKLGMVRRELFITNTLACRPPGNRDPEGDELTSCWQRLVNTIDIIQPSCLLLIGKPAAQHVLGREVFITKERGQVHLVTIGDRNLNAVLALHPSYILRHGLQEGGRRMREEFSKDLAKAWDIAKGWEDGDQIPF